VTRFTSQRGVTLSISIPLPSTCTASFLSTISPFAFVLLLTRILSVERHTLGLVVVDRLSVAERGSLELQHPGASRQRCDVIAPARRRKNFHVSRLIVVVVVVVVVVGTDHVVIRCRQAQHSTREAAYRLSLSSSTAAVARN